MTHRVQCPKFNVHCYLGMGWTMRATGLKRFLLFTTPLLGGRKDYVASYHSREEAIAAAEQINVNTGNRWQIIDNHTAEVVAEFPGG